MIELLLTLSPWTHDGDRPPTANASAPAAQQQGGDKDELGRHDASTTEAGEVPFELSSWLFDDIGKGRASLARRGFTLEAYLTVDLSAHPSGGEHPGSGATRGLLDSILTIDGDKVFGIPHGRFVLGLQAIGGDDGSAHVGVVQNYSNIDAVDDRVQLARIWYEQDWNDSATRVRVGKMDANALFGGVANATRFIHSSMAFSSTILGLPTYPETAFGIAVRQDLGGGFDFRLGAYDGAAHTGVKTGLNGPSTVFGGPSDAFLIAQIDYAWGAATDRGGHLALGGWRHTGDFDRFDGGKEDGADGFYVVLEQRVASDPAGRTLDAYLQFGQANAEVSPIEEHIGIGAVASNLLLPGRRDALGLGVSSARLSHATGAPFTADAETAIALFWGVDLGPGLRIKPDVQYILDPGGDASLKDALVLTLRMTLSL